VTPHPIERYRPLLGDEAFARIEAVAERARNEFEGRAIWHVSSTARGGGVAEILHALLRQRILVLDGAMGTMIQRHKLTEADFRGERFRNHPKDLRGNSDILVLTRPDVIGAIHREYLEAGADIITTNTFGGGSIVLAEYGLQDQVLEINEAAARLSRKAVDIYSRADRPRFVAGNMGPTTKSLTITGGIIFDEMIDVYHGWSKGLMAGGVDLLILETQNDTRTIKAALIGIEQTFEEAGARVLVQANLRAAGRAGRTEVREQRHHVWTVRAGRIARFEWFNSREEALAAFDSG